MLELRIFVLVVIFTLLYSTYASSKDTNGYIFTSPRSLKIGATNELQFRRYGNLAAGNLNVKMTFTDPQTSNETLAIEENYEIEEGVASTILPIKINTLDNNVHSGRLIINGSFVDGYEISGEDKINFSTVKENIVVVQTDKPLYKPGQTVKFRVLHVDKDLKPIENVKAEIWVRDASDARLFQWSKDFIESGFIQEEFPLTNEPSQGTWKISVSVKDEVTTSTFDVKEYVLPKYEVTITPPSFVLASTEEIPIKVCAKYTYGKPVEGKLYLNVSLEQYSYGKLPVLEEIIDLKGCLDYVIKVSRFDPGHNSLSYRRIQMVASVEDDAGTEINTTEYIRLQYSPLSMSFYQDQGQFFKPGLPYNGKLQVNNPDGTPASWEPVEICFAVSTERVQGLFVITVKTEFCSNYTSGDDGVIPYTLPLQNTDAVSINLEAKSLKYIRKERGTYREKALNQPQANLNLSPFYSPSDSFIQLQPKEKTLVCGTKTTVKLLFTSKEDADFKFYYQVITQGEVVKTGIVEKSFSTSDDVSNQFRDQEWLINYHEEQIIQTLGSFKAKTSKEEFSSAGEARHVPSIGAADIEIDVDPSLSTNFYLLVYYIRDDREMVADSQRFKVEKCFRNQVKLQFGDEVKQPGTRTSVKVSASRNSLCGIKVVDKGVSLLGSNDQLTKDKIFNLLDAMDKRTSYSSNHCNKPVAQPGLYRSPPYKIRPPQIEAYSSYEDSLSSFETAGFMVISDYVLLTRPCRFREKVQVKKNKFRAGRRMSKSRKVGTQRSSVQMAAGKTGGPTKSVVEVRNYFPETWLFDMEMTGDDGVYIQKEKLPHTVTEWIGSAACINEEDGLGISDTTSIKGFQAFFISYNLPYSVVRGEEFWATISIFNYVYDALPIKVSLDKSDDIEVTSKSFDGDICILPASSQNLKIKLKALNLGKVNITFRAETAESGDICGSVKVSVAYAKDAISDSIVVEAEGWLSEKVESTLFCPKEEENGLFTNKFTQALPEDLVEDSARAYLYLSGNLLGFSLENLQNLITIPTGCGEQNMIKFTPNVVVMNVLTKINELTESTRNKITRNLITGYQRQLKYKHEDGSFSAFGLRDKSGSMFLTSFVLWSFSEASKYITIDNSTIAVMQYWIASKQQMDGCFPDVGVIIHRELQGGLDSPGIITAYVLISLLKSGFTNQIILDSASSCMESNPQENAFGKFVYAYAYALAGNTAKAKEIINDAEKLAVTENGEEYYPIVDASKSTQIETVAYALLAKLLVGESASSVLPIVRYMSKNINPNGGFYSTQDTCVGLKALGEFSKLTYGDKLSIKIKAIGGLNEEIELSEEDRLLVKKYKISNVPSETTVEGTGTGCGVIQHVLRYNTRSPPKKDFFQLEVEGSCLNDCAKGIISVLVSYMPKNKKTGMAIVEVKMITGVVPEQESLEKLMDDKNLQLMRFEVDNNKIAFYFNELTNEFKQFAFDVHRVIEVPNPQPGTVEVYDYYNRDISGSKTYTF